MTEQHSTESTPRGGEPFADEPIPEAGPAGGAGGEGAANARGREWLSQLEAMIQDITTQAAPVARQVAAKAAELTAVAAVKAGPLAQRAAEVTNDAGQKLAERAQSLASELRGEAAGTQVEDVPWAADTTSADAAPEATFEDAVDSTTDGAPTTTFEDGPARDESTGGSSI